MFAGLAIRIVARDAVKSRSARPHLNIEFDSAIPSDARGIFAELAGVKSMSDATMAILKQPPAQ